MANPWEMDWTQGAPVTVGAPDPYKANDDAREAERLRIAKDTADRENAKFNERNAPTLKPGFRWKGGVPGGEAEPIPGIPLENSSLTSAQRSEALNAFNAANLLDKQIADIEAKFKAGPGRKSGPAGIMDFFPTEANDRFNTAGNKPRGAIGTALGFTGGQLNSVAEAEAAVGPYLPTSWNRDSVILDKIQSMRDVSTSAREKAIAVLGGVPDELGRVTPMAPPTQATATPSSAPPSIGRSNVPDLTGLADRNGGQASLATGQQQSAVAFPGLNNTVTQMIRQGSSLNDVVMTMSQAGNRPSPEALNAIQKNIEAVQQGYTGPLSVDVERQMVPLSGWQSMMNPAAQSPLGTGITTAGDAVTGFNLARFTDNPEQTRAGITGLQALNPKSALAGTVGGGVMAGAGLEAAAARLGLGGAGVLAPRLLASDAAYGGAAGYGLGGEDAGASDVLGGALIGLGGGAATRGAMRGVAGGVGPTGGGATPLYDQGVRPTPGQRFAGSGAFGKALNTAEQALQSVPLVGGMVASARQGARDQFETGGFNRALREIGQELPETAPRGPEAFKFTREAFNDTYGKARSGMQFVPDGQFGQDFGAFQRDVLSSGMLDAAGRKQVEDVIANSLGSRLKAQGGTLSGDVYKKTISDIRKLAKGQSRSEVRDAIQAFADIVEGGARRNSHPDAVALLDKADKGYAQYAPLKEAGRMAGNEPGRFTPKNLESVERRGMGKTNSFLEGDTLMGDYITAGRNLTDTLPNSGSAERLMTGQAVGGGVLGGAGAIATPAIPLGALAATLPYAPGVRNVTAGMMVPTDNAIRLRIAEELKRRMIPAGMFGAPLAIEASR